MKTSEITIRKCQDEDMKYILEMNHAFVDENCCNGMVKDTLEDLKKHVFI